MQQNNTIPYGARVDVDGWSGAVYVTRVRDGEIHYGVILDEDTTQLVRWFRYSDMQWLGTVTPGKIRPWLVKPPWVRTWDSAPERLFIVHTSTFMKARYKGWKALDALGLVGRDDLLLMNAKSAGTHDVCGDLDIQLTIPLGLGRHVTDE